jgi:hypothetical protein
MDHPQDRDAAAARQKSEGRVVLRRMNRREYEHTLHDLLGIAEPLAAQQHGAARRACRLEGRSLDREGSGSVTIWPLSFRSRRTVPSTSSTKRSSPSDVTPLEVDQRRKLDRSVYSSEPTARSCMPGRRARIKTRSRSLARKAAFNPLFLTMSMQTTCLPLKISR